MSAPIAAPAMPSPPMTLTMTSTITSTPMPGTTEIPGAVKAPPSAPSVAPITNVAVNMRDTLMPMAALISRS